MKPLRQASLLIRLLLLTGCWILIQVLLLPLTLHQNDLVMLYSSIGLLTLILGVTGYDSYCALRHTKTNPCSKRSPPHAPHKAAHCSRKLPRAGWCWGTMKVV